MTAENLEIVECTGNWLRNGIIEQTTMIHRPREEIEGNEGINAMVAALLEE
jgi:hypothetical protein